MRWVAAMLVACQAETTTPIDASPDATSNDASTTVDVASDGSTPNLCGDPESYMPTWATAAKPEKEIYVSPSGDDGNDGSQAKPLKTTGAALTKLAPGVRLNFATGTYACNLYIHDLLATRDKPAIIRSSDGPRKAKFACASTDSGIYLSKVSGIIVDGIELSGGSGHGMQVDSGSPFDKDALSHDVVLHASYIHDTQYASIKVAQSKFLWVIGNEFAKPGLVGQQRQNVELVVVDDSVIVGNEGHDSYQFDEVKGGAHRSLIALNRIHDSTGGIMIGGDCTGSQFLVDTTVDFEASEVVAWGNTIALPGAGSEAFRIVSCHDCLVANNTFWSTAPSVALRFIDSQFSCGGPSAVDTHNKNVRIINNVFSSVTPFNYMIASNAQDKSTFTLSHNAWFASGGTISGVLSDVPFKGEPASLYDTDPKLTAPPTSLVPASGSPLIGKGAVLPEVPASANGSCWASAPNIGAY